MDLPKFKYHPDPLKTGSIAASTKVCEICGQVRGFVYTASIYGLHNLDNVCPWCIADGTAHEKIGAEFTDQRLIGGHGWESVSLEIVQEVAFKTPGFSGWQQERWFTHCYDAGQFLGPMGKDQLLIYGESAIKVIRTECGYDATQWTEFFETLNAVKGPATAYLFKCLHCGEFGGYSDCL